MGNCTPTNRDQEHGYNVHVCDKIAKEQILKNYEPGKKKKQDNKRVRKKNNTEFIVYNFDQIKHKLYYTERSVLSIIWIKYLFEFHKYCKRFPHHNRLNIYHLNYLHIWSCNQKLKVDCSGLGRCRDQCISIYSSTENRKRDSYLYRSNLIKTKKNCLVHYVYLPLQQTYEFFHDDIFLDTFQQNLWSLSSQQLLVATRWNRDSILQTKHMEFNSLKHVKNYNCWNEDVIG